MKRGEKIRLPEFAAYLEVPVSDALEDMFSLFDEVSLTGELRAKPLAYECVSQS
jgi:hypothetical protein